jgi:WD40 repeat protein
MEDPYGRPQEEEEPVKRDANSEILRNPLRKLVNHHQNEIYDLSFNYNGNLLASCGGDRTIKIYDVHAMKTAATVHSPSAECVYIGVSLDYSGDRLLAGSTDKTVNIFHSQTGKHLHAFLGHGSKVNSVSWTSSRERCASGSDDKQLKVWDIEKASNVFSVSCGKGVKVVRSNNVEPVVYTGHSDGSVRVYSVSQGNAPVSQVKGVIDYAISSLTLLSNRHQVLATSLEGSTIHLLDLKMNATVCKFDHKDFFNSSAQGAMSPSETMALSGNCNGMIYYWKVQNQEMVRRVSGHDCGITGINYHFMSSILATGDKEGNMILWQ